MSSNDSNAQSAISGLMGVYNSAKEKWDSSGGNEALGRVSASIPDSTKQLMGSMFKREHIRGPTIFFGFGEERPFYVEKTPSMLMERLRHNAQLFYLNYFIITGVLFMLTLLTTPTTIIGLVLLAVGWMSLIRATQDGSLKIGAVSIPQKTAVIGMGAISVMVLIWLLSGVFWWTLFTSGFFVMVHAFLRDASMHQDYDDVVQMEGDLNIGEDTAFMNSRV